MYSYVKKKFCTYSADNKVSNFVVQKRLGMNKFVRTKSLSLCFNGHFQVDLC